MASISNIKAFFAPDRASTLLGVSQIQDPGTVLDSGIHACENMLAHGGGWCDSTTNQ
jgi:hypothetical protein